MRLSARERTHQKRSIFRGIFWQQTNWLDTRSWHHFRSCAHKSHASLSLSDRCAMACPSLNSWWSWDQYIFHTFTWDLFGVFSDNLIRLDFVIRFCHGKIDENDHLDGGHSLSFFSLSILSQFDNNLWREIKLIGMCWRLYLRKRKNETI